MSTDELFERVLVEMAIEEEDEDAWFELTSADGSAPAQLIALPGDEAFQRSIALLQHQDPEWRSVGARVLKWFGEDRPPQSRINAAVAALIQALEIDQDPDALADMISAVGPFHDQRAIPIVLGFTQHEHQPVRFSVACSLGDLYRPGSEHTLAVEWSLIRLCRDESKHVRDYAMFSLRATGIDSLAVRNAIASNLTDPYCKDEAAGTLAAFGDPRATPVLISDLNDYDFWSATTTVFDYAATRPDSRLLPVLDAIANSNREFDTEGLNKALAACRKLATEV